MNGKLRDEKGLTLVETVITLAVLGIMAGLAVPSIVGNWLPTMRVNSAARDLISEMQRARMKSVSERNNYVITFVSANNSYTILDDDDNDGVQTAGEFLKGPLTLPTGGGGIRFGRALGAANTIDCGGGINPSGININGGGNTLTFQPDGTPVLTGSVYVVPINDDENNNRGTFRWRAVSVNTTGRVRSWTYDAAIQNCGNLQGPWR